MTTITKERLLTIKQWRETYGPGSNVVLPAEEAEELARIALASLEAEPVAYIFKHPAGKLFWALTDESNKEQADVIPVYAAAPASVVPDNASEPLAYAYKELTPEIMRNHLAVFERYGIAPNDSSTTIQALRIALDGIERSDAMLHGAEPVSQTYKLNKLSGNSPATPDGWISCSERMPDTKTAVLVAVEFDRKGDWRMKWATYIPGHPDANDGWLIPGASWKPSHWMPLPEPPL
ncbi:DUF551 domain-containing protein [Escherichia coli]|uniref:DUF551 domain-containing protein n=1 Tax=Escherichia coli TaxID=562 RepID=UPI00077528AC|nr:DUF551 domain-containing protein [Escherichia coli]KXR45722.1 hypothetical protein AUQ31_16285 [Escherichia coli]